MRWVWGCLAMRWRNLRLTGVLAVLSVFTACQRSAPLLVSHPHYVIGKGWQGQDGWFYPAESFELRQTGLAIRETDTTPHLTADGEIWNAGSMTGAHQTLQLPAVVTLRNISNGRTVRIRLNERGPRSSGRLVAVTPKVAELLGIMSQQPAPVELIVDEPASRAMAEASPDAPKLDIASAPRGDVVAESLDGKGGAARSVGSHESAWGRSSGGLVLENLPVQVMAGYAQPVSYAIQFGSFAGRAAATQVALRCGAAVTTSAEAGRGLNWLVVKGPLATVAEADNALAQAHGCGIAGARIVVE